MVTTGRFTTKVGNFNCPYPLEGQNASPCRILCRSPSWICYTRVWTSHEVYFGGFCHCAKFGLNRFSSFDNMQVLIFLALSLKMPIHAHFGGVLGVKIGEIGFFL